MDINLFTGTSSFGDILVCFNGTHRQIDTFLQYLNTVHYNIKFTMELKSNNLTNFLDLSIKKFNNKHQFSINLTF